MAAEILLHRPVWVQVDGESTSTVTVSMAVEYRYGPPGVFFPVPFTTRFVDYAKPKKSQP